MRYSRLQNSDTHMINIGMSPAHELKMEVNYHHNALNASESGVKYRILTDTGDTWSTHIHNVVASHPHFIYFD